MMTTESRAARWRGWWACSMLAVVAGMYVVLAPVGAPLRRMSYDLPHLAANPARHTNIVLVYVDDLSLRELGRRPDGALERRWHTGLLRRLTGDGARMVVFDMAFTRADAGDPSDRELAQAMRANGRVVLAATYETIVELDVATRRVLPPAELFATNAAAIGMAFLEPDTDRVVRLMPGEVQREPSLAWSAMEQSQSWQTDADRSRERERWLRHYRPGGGRSSAFDEFSLRTVVASNGVAPGFFRDKFVFIGGRRSVGPVGEERDRFATPLSAWAEGYSEAPGVALHATAFANLQRGEWLERFSAGEEALVMFLAGVLMAATLFQLRPLAALLAGLAWGGAVSWAGFQLQLRGGVAFPWLAALLAPLPVCFLWALGRNWLKPGPPVAFISYRRREGEGSGYAFGLWHALRAHGVATHLDVEGLKTEAWKEQLARRIESVPNFILLITPRSLDLERIADPAGKEDAFRWEMETARRSGRNIIVVLIEPARLPDKSAPLPESLRWLHDPEQQLQAWTYRHDDPGRLLAHVLGRLEGRPGTRLWFRHRLRWPRRGERQP